MHDTSYAPDILIALVSTATFGGWGLAGAATFSLARHSPIVRDGIAQLAPQVVEHVRSLPDVLGATPRDRAIQRHATSAQPARPASAPPQSARPRWLEVINDDMDRAPHTLILGPSGAGKTTLATAIMGDRGGRAIVLTPKVAPGNWSGAELVTLDDDGSYAPLSAAMRDLEDEKRGRIVALRRHGRDALEPLTVVFDELQDLTAHVPEVGEFMVNMSSIGREVKMRLIGVGTTDDALNIRGWKASRRNYLRVELDRDRRAELSDGVRTIAVGTRDALARAGVARLRPWRGEEPAPVAPPPTCVVAADAPRATPDDLLASLMTDLPADVRAQVPSISPERAERLARILASVPAHQDAEITPSQNGTVTQNDNSTTRSSVSVASGNGGITVNVAQVASGRAMPRGGRGINVKARRLRGVYRKAGADGISFRAAYDKYGGSRNDVFTAWQEGRAQKAGPS